MRLGQIVLRTVAERLDRRVDGAFGRQDDERYVDLRHLAAVVGEDQIEGYFFAQIGCGGLVFDGFGREAFEFEPFAQVVSHTF